VFDPKGFLDQAQSSEREENADHNCGLILVTGEGIILLCKHQKCEHRKGSKTASTSLARNESLQRSGSKMRMMDRCRLRFTKKFEMQGRKGHANDSRESNKVAK
jgi:hypothetical protein